MKKIIVLLLTLALAIGACAFAQAEAPQGVVSVKALAQNFDVNHRLSALIIEYSEDVAAPTMDTYEIVDTAMATYSAQEERRDSDTAVISTVYTNSEPALRADKKAVPGRYVIIELRGNFPVIFDEELGYYVIQNTACFATWRHKGENSNWKRNDYSEMTITQKNDLLAPDGHVVAAAGNLPELQAADVTNLIIDDFQQLTLAAANGKHDIHFNLWLPENYDESKKYPLVISIGGGGSMLNYAQQDDAGTLLTLGCNITADQVATSFAKLDEDVIILSHQLWRGAPEEWEVDNVADGIQLFEYVIANYAVDVDRVYAIGSSAGTSQLGGLLAQRPDLVTAYIQSNGDFLCGSNFVVDKANRGARSGYTAAQMFDEIEANHMDKSEYLDKAVELYKPVLEDDLIIYMIANLGDETGACMNTLCAYTAMKEAAQELGMTEEEFNAKVTLHLVMEQEMLEKGICKFHACSKYVVLNDELVAWLMSR